MTEHKHLKALIRARMARTGESYVVARRHLVDASGEPGLEPAADFEAHERHCMTAVFAPDGRRLLSGGFGGQLRIWTIDGEPDGELAGHAASVNLIRVSPDGSLAVSASSDKTVRLWDLPSREQRALLGSHRRQVIALDLDAARERVWSGAPDGTVIGWDVGTGQRAERVDLGAEVTSLAVRGADGTLAVATARAGVSVRAGADEVVRLSSDSLVTAVAWTADGSFLVVSGADGASVWSSDDWQQVWTMAFGGAGVHPLALSPDGSRIVLGWDHHIALWTAGGEEAAVTIDGLPKGVYGLAFSPDGRMVALACADGRVRTWRVR
jgi:WD40 repeat protein